MLDFVVDTPVFGFRTAHLECAAFNPHKAVIHLLFLAFRLRRFRAVCRDRRIRGGLFSGFLLVHSSPG